MQVDLNLKEFFTLTLNLKMFYLEGFILQWNIQPDYREAKNI